MKKPKISVIVPVYNTEKYLEKCLNSLLNQTYDNLEIIVVEDCSNDNCKKILEKYKSNSRIKVIYNKTNRGLSFSRNTGLANATGEYIGYIDSDDYIDSDYYEKLMSTILKNNAEISICDIKIVYEENKMEYLSKCYNDEKFSLFNVINNGLAASACNKLFKKSLIEKYSFAEGKINEDIAVIIPTLINAKKISYAEKCYYYYVQHLSSIQNSKFSEKKFDIFDGVELTIKRIKKSKNFENYKDALIYNQLICMFLYVVPKEKNLFKRRSIIKKFDKLSRKYDIVNNKTFIKFLNNTGKKHSIYYKLLVKLTTRGHYTLANLLILTYDVLSVFLKKKCVINMNADIDDLIDLAKKNSKKKEPIKISVVVPNYNYARFINQRLFSILNQDYPIYELIILDDCSKDNSKEVIDNIYIKLKKYINIKVIYNENNSGSAFKQWQKGFENATGDYVWIAEADDYCEKNLLKNLVKPCINDKNIIISYSDTAFIDVFGKTLIKSIKPEIDIQKTGHWNKSYINSGKEELENYCYLNCTIANVSSCIIKNNNYADILNEAGNYKQAGDWFFYANVIYNDKIAYTDKVLNYYRVHGDNVSSTMNRKKHIEEIKKIHNYFIKKFKLGINHKDNMNKRIEFLKKTWKVD